jgi:hypothetical protein
MREKRKQKQKQYGYQSGFGKRRNVTRDENGMFRFEVRPFMKGYAKSPRGRFGC